MTESWDVRLLTASYRREGPEEEPVIELFGRTRDGRSLIAEYRGFKPYFYVIEPPQSLIGYLKNDPEVLGIDDVYLEVDGTKRKCSKVTLKHPWKTPEYRNKCKNYDRGVLAADIPFAHRFIYDMDLASCVRIWGKEIQGNYTTDIVVEAERFEECEPFNPRLKILSFDIENSMKDAHIFCLGVAMRENGGIQTRYFTGSEGDIIRSFVKFVQEKDPDVITGYNIDGYDIPVFLERARKNRIEELQLGRDYQPLSDIGERFWRLHGRIIADAWWTVKMELKPKQETLDHVAKILLGEGKFEVDRTKIDEEWERNRDGVIEYCLKDAELSLKILEKLARLDKAMDLATVSKLPLDDVFNGRTSNLIDSILIRVADREGVGVPMMRTRGGTESIEGGYVHSLQPGLYEWVAVMDFRSMYPSIIIENNICFTTLSDKGSIVSPIGVRFLSKEERLGLLPRILENIMREREEIRRKMKAATGDQKDYYERLQAAIKVLMNAFYGVLASSFYRFTNPKIGASITAFARENIKGVIKKLEEEGIRVIYADTDSVFFESPHKNLEGTLEIGRRIAESFSRGGATLEFESVLRSFFSHGKKKRYVGKVVWPKEEMVVRGYEIRRTDAFDLQSEAQTAVFEKILDNDIEGALKLSKQMVRDIQDGTIPVDKFVISRTVKDYSLYVNPESMSNVQAAKKLQAMGYEFVPGMKVSWIVTSGKKSPQEVQPYVSGRPFEGSPDWDYYARRLAQTLSYATEVFGWDEKSLLVGNQQATLFREDFGEGRIKKGVKKTEKRLTLEDFM